MSGYPRIAFTLLPIESQLWTTISNTVFWLIGIRCWLDKFLYYLFMEGKYSRINTSYYRKGLLSWLTRNLYLLYLLLGRHSYSYLGVRVTSLRTVCEDEKRRKGNLPIVIMRFGSRFVLTVNSGVDDAFREISQSELLSDGFLLTSSRKSIPPNLAGSSRTGLSTLIFSALSKDPKLQYEVLSPSSHLPFLLGWHCKISQSRVSNAASLARPASHGCPRDWHSPH